jgi:hypothetical protein
LLKRRTQSGISHEKELTQKVVIALLSAACIVLVVEPWQISVIGDAVAALSFYIFYLVSKVNTYAAANVQIEQ